MDYYIYIYIYIYNDDTYDVVYCHAFIKYTYMHAYIHTFAYNDDTYEAVSHGKANTFYSKRTHSIVREHILY